MKEETKTKLYKGEEMENVLFVLVVLPIVLVTTVFAFVTITIVLVGAIVANIVAFTKDLVK